MMKKTLNGLKYGVGFSVIFYGIWSCYKEFCAINSHPEWSVPLYVVGIKLFLFGMVVVVWMLLMSLLIKRICQSEVGSK